MEYRPYAGRETSNKVDGAVDAKADVFTAALMFCLADVHTQSQVAPPTIGPTQGVASPGGECASMSCALWFAHVPLWSTGLQQAGKHPIRWIAKLMLRGLPMRMS